MGKVKFSNQTYDILKRFSMFGIPALNVFILKMDEIWTLPLAAKIAATVSAFGVLIAGLLEMSTYNYNNDVDPEPEDEEEEL